MILGVHCAESSCWEFSSEILLNITKITVFWDVVLWTVVKIYPSGGMYCRNVPPKCWIFYSTAWHHIPEGGNSCSHCCKTLISCINLPGCSVSHFRQLQSWGMSVNLHFCLILLYICYLLQNVLAHKDSTWNVLMLVSLSGFSLWPFAELFKNL